MQHPGWGGAISASCRFRLGRSGGATNGLRDVSLMWSSRGTAINNVPLDRDGSSQRGRLR